MKILSLFDGMACGMLAMQNAGIEVDRYVAFEIDKYAVQTSSHNFPMIEHRGDVFQADFTEFSGFDFLVGGSPCTYWSIAQKNNRETEASGMGWELFSQYVRALREAKPMYFIYENNKSMANAIRESITETFGFEPICINSALVSAQNRQRLYWVGRRNLDGTYSRVKVEQPADRGILLRDILDCGNPFGTNTHEKGFCLTARYHKGVGTSPNKVLERKQDTLVAEPVRIPEYGNEGKARPLNATYPNNCGGFEHRMFSENPNKQQVDLIATPVCEPLNTTAEGLYAIQCCPMQVKEATKQGFTEINPGECVDLTQPNSKTRRGRNMAEKTNCLMTSCQFWQYCGILAYATPCEWDESGRPTKAVSGSDGKVYTVYEVKDGWITIKGKQYPIKLVAGHYIIRKLTVSECKRLQTVPEGYEFPVSDTQAYKMLGNGWTVEVIAHLIKATQADDLEEEQLDLFKMGVS